MKPEKQKQIAGDVKCQVCGCTELNACQTQDGPCSWIAEGVLCSACFERVPQPRTDREMAVAISPLVQDAVQFGLPGVESFYVLSLIQLAARHPEVPDTLREFAESFGRGLQQRISHTPALAAMMEAGWRPKEDKPRLLLPGRDFVC